MKNFLLLLFSEQTPSGVKDTSAAAAQTSFTDTALSRESGVTGDTSPVAGEVSDTSRTRREIYDEFIRANKDFFTEDTQKIISLRVKEAGPDQCGHRSHQTGRYPSAASECLL